MDARYHQNMLQRRAGRVNLPADYMLATYLANPNSAYINTLYRHRSGTRYIVNVRNGSQTTNSRILGFGNAGYTSYRLQIALNYNSTTRHSLDCFYYTRISDANVDSSNSRYNRFTVELDATDGSPSVWVDGVRKSTDTTSYAYNYNVLLFNTHPSQSNTFFTQRLYWCRIIYGNAMARNLVPCVRLSDGKPGMYDLCGSTCTLTGSPFYISANSSEFTWG